MAGIILAGGKSNRMGYDKTCMLIGGTPIIEKTIASLVILFNEIIVCGKIHQNIVSDHVKCVEDIYRHVGPVGGIYTGLYYSASDINFITACDIPGINIGVIKYMSLSLKSHDAVVIKSGDFCEPLFGFYRRRILSEIKYCIENGICKVSDLYKYIDVKFLTEEEVKTAVPEYRGLSNINTQKDYENYIKERTI